MNIATLNASLSALRALLVATGAIRSYVSDDTLTEMTGNLMVLLPVLWGIWNAYSVELKAKAREVIALNVGIVVADNTTGTTPIIPAVAVPNLIKSVTGGKA